MIANGARALIIRVLDNIGLVQDLNHEGDVILDKLISDIKSRIPGRKKQDEDLDIDDSSLEVDGASDLTDSDFKADKTGVTQIGDIDLDDEEDLDDGEEEGEEKASVSIVYKIKALLNKKKTPKKKEASGKTAKTPEKKSFISKPIAAVLLLGILAFLFGEDLLTPQNETPAVDPELAAFEKKKKDKIAQIKAKEDAAKAATPDTATPTEPVGEPTLPGEAPTEDVSTTTEKPPVDTSATDASTPMVDITPPVETAPETGETPTDTTIATETPSETPVETPTETQTETPMVTSPSDTSSQDTVDSDATTATEENMTDKILEDLEKQVKQTAPRPQVTTYVAPPDYEYRGRGLVYNCVGKHWACIDGPSYRVCEDNSSGTKFLNKKHECYPFNVYQTQNGCEKTQNRMVSSGAKTNFCNE